MKKFIITIVLLTSIACSQESQQDAASRAEALIARKEYHKAFVLLNQALHDPTISSLQRVHILKSLAEFNEKLIGNHDEALRLYGEILKTELAADHPIKSSVQKEISRLKSSEDKYREQNELLKKARISSSRQEIESARREQIELLQTLIKNNPEYYRLSEIYYYLGQNYMELKEYKKSCKSYEKSMQLKPAINFLLPVKVRADLARSRWLTATTNTVTWGTIGILLVLAVIVFYISMPWQWLRLKHLIPGLLTIFLWWAVFNVSHKWLGERFEVTETEINKIGAERPCFAKAAPTSPGSRITKYLFLYGLVGVIGVFVFSIGVSKIKRLPVRLLINSAFGLLLFASLTTIFYMRFCDHQSKFASQSKNGLYYLKGSLYFVVREPEPHILTNPKAYPNLSIGNIENSDLREWVVQHCPFDTPNEKAKQPKRK